MKTSFDPRHRKRKRVIQALFAWGFQKKKITNELGKQVVNHLKKIDALISKSAPQWPIEQINRIDLAILRLALFELIIVKKEPVKVIVDEAIELAKEFGGESSPAFVNGVLGAVLNG